MSHEGDRRAPGTTRVPFDALVEVGGELGPSFEAQAIDISEEGMHLRTAYLPEIGQPLVFRFDAGPGRQVTATAEVTWKQEEGKGGEFGARFLGLDGEALASLATILGFGASPPQQATGSRVRLHIEGLASPMRARVKMSSGTEITAFSELGFLQVGKQLELEDAQSGTKRPACIDRVDVEIDKETRVPQLVVTLRYDDVPAHAVHQAEAEHQRAEDAEQHDAHDTPSDEPHAPAHAHAHDMDHGSGPAVGAPEESAPAAAQHAPPAEAHTASASAQAASDDASVDEESSKMRGAIARGASKVGPAFAAMMTRAKVTMALLAAKRHGGTKDDVAVPFRRMTAPPPGGALHASGRKVVRSDPELDAAMKDDVPVKKLSITKRRAIVGGAIGVAAILAFVALRKPAPQAPLANAPPPDTAATSVPLTPAPPGAAGIDPMTSTLTTPLTPTDPASLSPAAKDDKEAKAVKKKVAPFGNGPVAHGNVLHLKMDGAIDKLEGAQQPTGFTVVVPSRRSLEPAGPLASRDSRIASIHVSNEANGAELSVAFKDGVPNYQVRAHGDTLEIAIAPIGQVNDGKSGGTHSVQAKHNEGGGKPHGKSHKSSGSQHD